MKRIVLMIMILSLMTLSCSDTQTQTGSNATGVVKFRVGSEFCGSGPVIPKVDLRISQDSAKVVDSFYKMTKVAYTMSASLSVGDSITVSVTNLKEAATYFVAGKAGGRVYGPLESFEGLALNNGDTLFQTTSGAGCLGDRIVWKMNGSYYYQIWSTVTVKRMVTPTATPPDKLGS